MRFSEGLAAGYFGAMTAAAWLRPLPALRRIQVTMISVVASAAIVGVARGGAPLARDWLPAVLILAGYVVSGRFYLGSSPAIEAWLMGWDHRLLGDPATRFAHWPRLLLAFLEVVYLGCFLVVPAGYAALWWAGRTDLADHYWTMVVAAEFGAFAPLAVFQTRPPWAIERRAAQRDRAIHQMAAEMVSTFTIRANTFPSGHAAGSLAVACALAGALPWVSLALLAIAVSICVACVVGRYHYTVDVIAGAALALAIWGAMWTAGR